MYYKYLTIVIVILLFAINAYAASCTFEWDPNKESDLAGYKLYWGTSSRNYENSIDVKNVTTFEVTDLPDGELYFSATAYDAEGNESDYSNEVVVTFNTIPPGAPLNFRVTVTEAKSITIEVD